MKAWNKEYDKMRTETLTLIRAHEVFLTKSFLHNRLRLFRIGDALERVPNDPNVFELKWL